MFVKETKSAGGVVVGKDGRILVVNQRGNSWSLPKGHIDEGEDALSAAKREIFEEAGVKDLVLIKSLPSYKRFKIGQGGEGEDRTELKKIDMFLFKTGEEELLPHDPDNPEARWVDKNEVSGLLTHSKDKEYFQKILFEIENLK